MGNGTKAVRGGKGRRKGMVAENGRQSICSGVSKALCVLKTFI